jgi:glucokinase
MLVADIGGTKSIFAVVRDGEKNVVEGIQSFSSRDSSDFESLLGSYLAAHAIKDQSDLVIGVAGPVFDNSCTATNLPWKLIGRQISERFGLRNVGMINDLAAHAYGISLCRPQHLVTLNVGKSIKGQAALIAAGTGLGEAIICNFPSDHPTVISTEGGHCDFAPTNDVEIELLRFLLQQHKRVSWERVVSGSMGFANIYRFFAQREPANIAVPCSDSMLPHDFGPFVTSAANQGCPVALKTMELFVRLYGAEAGNLALKCLATAGIYIAGGVGPKILKWIKDYPWFLEGLTNKGRFSELVRQMPVTLITDPDLALLGAYRYGKLNRMN